MQLNHGANRKSKFEWPHGEMICLNYLAQSKRVPGMRSDHLHAVGPDLAAGSVHLLLRSWVITNIHLHGG